MSALVGNGLTTTDARTGQRISVNLIAYGGNDLNSTGATMVPAESADTGFAFFNCGEGRGRIVLSKAGYRTRVESVTFPIPTNINYAMEPDGSPIPPPPGDLHLEQRGNDFTDATGRRIVFAGIDGFMDYRLWLDGGPTALDPFLQESTDCGFQVRRVFLMGSKAQNQIMDLSPDEPLFYAELRPFVEYMNAHGVIPLLTVNVDAEDVLPDRAERIANWQRIAAETDGTKRLMSGGNQWSKNGFNPWDDVPDPGHGVIWSRGSDVDDTITQPHGAPASELHATRNSFDRALMDATASPPFMRKPENGGAGMVWMTEGNPFGDGNGYTPEQAWQLGRGYSILWALAVFHNRQSQRGQLMTPATVACAKAFVKGLTL